MITESKPYDVNMEFNGKPVRSVNDLITAVTAVGVGDTVSLKVSRAGQVKALNIKVGQRPGIQQASQKEEKRTKKPKKSAPVETGMTHEDMTPELAKELGLREKLTGVVVSNVAYGGPADKAGLIRGDVILEVDRKAIKDSDAFYSVVTSKKSYLLRIRRSDAQGHEAFAVVVLDLKQEG